MAVHNASYVQRLFRGRNDDGGEAAASWIAPQNTNWGQENGGIFRARFTAHQDTNNANANLSKAFKIKFSHNGAAFVDVGAKSASGIAVRYADSPNVSDGQATTQQLPHDNAFVPGEILESPTGTINFPSGQRSETELEAVLEIVAAEVAVDDTIALRVYEDDDTALSDYDNEPTITITEPVEVPDAPENIVVDAVWGHSFRLHFDEGPTNNIDIEIDSVVDPELEGIVATEPTSGLRQIRVGRLASGTNFDVRIRFAPDGEWSDVIPITTLGPGLPPTSWDFVDEPTDWSLVENAVWQNERIELEPHARAFVDPDRYVMGDVFIAEFARLSGTGPHDGRHVLEFDTPMGGIIDVDIDSGSMFFQVWVPRRNQTTSTHDVNWVELTYEVDVERW
jgi:hypothetical protein